MNGAYRVLEMSNGGDVFIDYYENENDNSTTRFFVCMIHIIIK